MESDSIFVRIVDYIILIFIYVVFIVRRMNVYTYRERDFLVMDSKMKFLMILE